MNLLTICIPTYNRAGFLDKALDALLPQVAANADKGVAVFVSNNCSTDNTEELVRQYQQKYPGLIQYKCQPKMNPQHFRDVAHSVQSKYVALMGDDDFIMPGYMDKILDCISKHPDVALINYSVINYFENHYLDIRDPMFCSGKGKYYTSGGEFIMEHHHCPSLMSSNVFLLEDYLKTQDTINDSDYPGYEWYMALLKSVIHKPCLYIDTPLVWVNCPNSVAWEKYALNIYMCGFGRVFKDLDAEYHGIYESWLKVFETSWFNKKCIYLARKYRDTTSKAVYKDIIKYAYSKEYAKKLNIAINYPSIISRIYMYWVDQALPFLKRHI